MDDPTNELAMELFVAFWAAVDRNEQHYPRKRRKGIFRRVDHPGESAPCRPDVMMVMRDPDCEMPPRLWVYMAEALAAMDRA